MELHTIVRRKDAKPCQDLLWIIEPELNMSPPGGMLPRNKCQSTCMHDLFGVDTTITAHTQHLGYFAQGKERKGHLWVPQIAAIAKGKEVRDSS